MVRWLPLVLMAALMGASPATALAGDTEAAATAAKTKKKKPATKPPAKPAPEPPTTKKKPPAIPQGPAKKPATTKPATKPSPTPSTPEVHETEPASARPPAEHEDRKAPPAHETETKRPAEKGPEHETAATRPAEGRSADRPAPKHTTAAVRRADASPPAPEHSVAHGRPASSAPPYTTRDHRWARPRWDHVHHDIDAHHPHPHHWYYTPWYTHWWVHPYYRWHHSTIVVVQFGWVSYAWVDTWAPPHRDGWVWVPGHQAGHYWIPGHFAPIAPPPVWRHASYVYVPGWWMGDVYVEGYYRVADRDGWRWVDGYYLEDGTYVWGYWEPTGAGPKGYEWEHGYWDGDTWVEGFWRPEYRVGYRWVSAAYGADGIYRAGYWEPLADNPGYVWVPGWFDGSEWIPGYWVAEAEFAAADPASWTPPEGWDAGRDATAAAPAEGDEAPIAIPVGGEP